MKKKFLEDEEEVIQEELPQQEESEDFAFNENRIKNILSKLDKKDRPAGYDEKYRIDKAAELDAEIREGQALKRDEFVRNRPSQIDTVKQSGASAISSEAPAVQVIKGKPLPPQGQLLEVGEAAGLKDKLDNIKTQIKQGVDPKTLSQLREAPAVATPEQRELMKTLTNQTPVDIKASSIDTKKALSEIDLKRAALFAKKGKEIPQDIAERIGKDGMKKLTSALGSGAKFVGKGIPVAGFLANLGTALYTGDAAAALPSEIAPTELAETDFAKTRKEEYDRFIDAQEEGYSNQTDRQLERLKELDKQGRIDALKRLQGRN
jgi:hypothetical protein